MSQLILGLNNLLWETLVIYFLIFVGLWFTVKTRFVQIRLFSVAFRAMINSRHRDSESQISSFQAFCTSLAARIGTGNIAGVAVAIFLGGPGAVFWMWLIATLGMVLSLAENTLAQVYKVSEGNGLYRGGPAYYIEKGLNKRNWANAFAIILVWSYGFAFNGVQSNSITAALKGYDIPIFYSGMCLTFVSSLVIFGGIRLISRVAEILVPIMAIFYLGVAVIIVMMNIQELPNVLRLIISSAFGVTTATSGAMGHMVSQVIVQGVKRGVFSSEAGMGTAPNAAALAHTSHPIDQGLLGMFGVFIDTIVVCTATAAIILMSGVSEQYPSLTGIELTQMALTRQLGGVGKHLISISISCFAFTSIIANYYYGEANLIFIKNSKQWVFWYRISAIIMVWVGATGDLSTIWAFADISVGVMTVINLITIISLSSIVFKLLRDYEGQIAKEKIPKFNRKKFPDLNKSIDSTVWL